MQYDELKSKIDRLENWWENKLNNTIKVQSILYQNVPNPFNAETKIKVYIPKSVNSAYFNIYDLHGKEIKSILVDERNETIITINTNTLQKGIYIYSLIPDDIEIDSKK